MARGCVIGLSESLQQQCLSNDDSCKTCTNSACNNKNVFPTCITSKNDNGLVSWYNQNISTKICSNYTDKCFVLVENDLVKRGCFEEYAKQNNIISTDKYLEEKVGSRRIKTCSTPNCNVDKLKPINCIVCDSKNNLSCHNPVASEMALKCELKIDGNACYHYQNGSDVKRGCLHQLDDSFRKTCEENSENCKVCSEDVCNSKSNFLQCVSCDANKDSCESKVCKNYDNECYIHVQNNQIQRGCLNDLPKKAMKGTNIRFDCKEYESDICEKCSDQIDCNNRIIEVEFCLNCTSEDSYSCKSNPNPGMREKCPLNLKPLGCYLFEHRKDLKRGCLSSLDKLERNNCREDGNGKCKSCFGDSCNQKANFQSCFSCASENTNNCAIPMITDEIVCNNYLSQCYTEVKNGILRRGCIGDSFMSEEKDCSTPYCELCSKNRCNNEEIHQEVCVSCDSINDPTCSTNKTFDVTEECRFSAIPEGCYHFINRTDGHDKRGCVYNLSEDLVEKYKDSDDYNVCLGSMCNNKQFSRCIQCSSLYDPNCGLTPDTSNPRICSDYDDVCFSSIERYSINRGCLLEYAKQSRNMNKDYCRANRLKCKMCSTKACNKDSIRTDTCIKCVYNQTAGNPSDENNDTECITGPDNLKSSICDTFSVIKYMGCYLESSNDDKYVRRGCIQDLLHLERIKCDEQTDNCKTCIGKNCNQKISFQNCIECNSRDDPQCAINATSSNSIICPDYMDNCIVGTNEDGITHRSCAGKFPHDPSMFLNKFKIGHPNDFVFPENRLQCYQCSGDRECSFVGNLYRNKTILKPQPCAILSKHDQCYTYISKKGVVDERILNICNAVFTHLFIVV